MGVAAIILAAGKGKRMKSDLPKVLHEVAGKSLLEHVLDSIDVVGPDRIYVVVGHGAREVIRKLHKDDVRFVDQEEQLGTGHAVLQCEKYLADFEGTVIVLNGDVPGISPDTIEDFISFHRRSGSVATVLTAEFEHPRGYGRIVRNGSGALLGIVEEKEATEQERNIKEINAGMFCFSKSELYKALREIGCDNAQGEYYLTDVIAVLRSWNLTVSAYRVGDPREVAGVNTPAELEEMDRYLRSREK